MPLTACERFKGHTFSPNLVTVHPVDSEKTGWDRQTGQQYIDFNNMCKTKFQKEVVFVLKLTLESITGQVKLKLVDSLQRRI